jgi:hypothetical protein
MDQKTNRQGSMFWRTVIGLGVLLTAIRVWTGPVLLVEPASAQIPDSGLQRQQLLEETRRTNQLLQEITKTLNSGTLNVRFPSADNPSDAPKETRKRG